MESDIRTKAPAGLAERVVGAISRHERTRAAAMFWASIATGASSALAGVGAFQYAAAQLAQSGFASYLSLVGTDFDAVAAHWQEFALSLGESLPILALIAVAAAIAVFLGSIRVFVDARAMRMLDANAHV